MKKIIFLIFVLSILLTACSAPVTTPADPEPVMSSGPNPDDIDRVCKRLMVTWPISQAVRYDTKDDITFVSLVASTSEGYIVNFGIEENTVYKNGLKITGQEAEAAVLEIYAKQGVQNPILVYQSKKSGNSITATCKPYKS